MSVSPIHIKMKFPEFAGYENVNIQFAIDEAALEVNDGWYARDRDIAVMYLAAHLLATSAAESTILEEGGREVVSERIGPMSTTYKQTGAGGANAPSRGDLTTTSYGVRFKRLRDLNFPAIGVI
jgi:hypothetical protein